jgi:hypothetical protein
VAVVENPPADAQDHRPVTRRQGLEGRLVRPLREPPEQLAVRQPGDRPQCQKTIEPPTIGPFQVASHPFSFTRPSPIPLPNYCGLDYQSIHQSAKSIAIFENPRDTEVPTRRVR